MSTTLLNVSCKAEELLNIALLLVQSLFCLPSLNLKIGLGVGFVFPFFVPCPWNLSMGGAGEGYFVSASGYWSQACLE